MCSLPKFPKLAGQHWISQMLYCLMFFHSVLDPIAHDYSQVQNRMHKQLQQQFTDCELNQPIVSSISCSLLIWKEPGRWLPLQLASCGQLSLLVWFCTLLLLRHENVQKSCRPKNSVFQTSKLMFTHHSLQWPTVLSRAEWSLQPLADQTSRNATWKKTFHTSAEEQGKEIDIHLQRGKCLQERKQLNIINQEARKIHCKMDQLRMENILYYHNDLHGGISRN